MNKELTFYETMIGKRKITNQTEQIEFLCNKAAMDILIPPKLFIKEAIKFREKDFIMSVLADKEDYEFYFVIHMTNLFKVPLPLMLARIYSIHKKDVDKLNNILDLYKDQSKNNQDKTLNLSKEVL